MARDHITAFCEAVWRQERHTSGLLVRRVDPNGKDRWGRTPLLMAAQYGDLTLVAELVRRGGVIDQQRRYLTPLTLAARRKVNDIVTCLMERGEDGLNQGRIALLTYKQRIEPFGHKCAHRLMTTADSGT